MKKGIIIVTLAIFILFTINFVFAEKLEIQIKEATPEKIKFRAVLYDDGNNQLEGELSYIIRDLYSQDIASGKILSGLEIENLPERGVFESGSYEVSLSYYDYNIREIFNIDELKKLDINLEGEYLIIRNIGNVIYDKDIILKIDDYSEAIRVYLDIGQIKKIRLTGPPGEHTVKIDDGSGSDNLVFNGVSLTGNVIGFENVQEGGFFKRYPLVSLFLMTLLIVSLIVFSMKFYKKS
ncbi:MAG: hypothetical protein WC867_06120 [Candidatus Pacearchaeota archaeon]|jgi:hypothetical protein